MCEANSVSTGCVDSLKHYCTANSPACEVVEAALGATPVTRFDVGVIATSLATALAATSLQLDLQALAFEFPRRAESQEEGAVIMKK
jgi:hypothetical protein